MVGVGASQLERCKAHGKKGMGRHHQRLHSGDDPWFQRIPTSNHDSARPQNHE